MHVPALTAGRRFHYRPCCRQSKRLVYRYRSGTVWLPCPFFERTLGVRRARPPRGSPPRNRQRWKACTPAGPIAVLGTSAVHVSLRSDSFDFARPESALVLAILFQQAGYARPGIGFKPRHL